MGRNLLSLLFITFFASQLASAQNSKSLWGISSQNINGTIFRLDTTAKGYQTVNLLDNNNIDGILSGTLVAVDSNRLLGINGSGVFDYNLKEGRVRQLYQFSSFGFIGTVFSGRALKASDGNYYTTSRGEFSSFGRSGFLKIDLGDTTSTGYPFNPNIGHYAFSELVETNGKIYGTCSYQANNNEGSIFSYDLTADTVVKEEDMSAIGMFRPFGGLIKYNNNSLIGLANLGGSSDDGGIFEFNPQTANLVELISLDSATSGRGPRSKLLLAADGLLYGVATFGGAQNLGTLFRYDYAANQITKLHDFDSINGSSPVGALIEASNGKLYGMAQNGGAFNQGVFYEYDIATDTFSKLLDFNGIEGELPQGSLFEATNGLIYGMTSAGGTDGSGVIFSFDPDNNTFIKTVDIGGATRGRAPQSSMIQAKDGRLYGANLFGGRYGVGNLYSYHPYDETEGYQVIHDFDTLNGQRPYGKLTEVATGEIVGTASAGGANDKGIIFHYNYLTSTFDTLFSFDGAINGDIPNGALYQIGRQLYGTTEKGGNANQGVIYRYDLDANTFTKLHDFDGGANAYRIDAPLIQASNGLLYGTATDGGDQNLGIIYAFDLANNTFTKLHDFSGQDGDGPVSRLTQASDGKLYGVTTTGGLNNDGVLYAYDAVSDSLEVKFHFARNEGINPNRGLIELDGKLYGTAFYGGNFPTIGFRGYGTAFYYDIAQDTLVRTVEFDARETNFPVGELTAVDSCHQPFLAGFGLSMDTVCQGTAVSLSLNQASQLNDASNWSIFQAGGIVALASSTSNTLSFVPTQSDIYELRAVGSCVTSLVNDSFIVVVNPVDTSVMVSEPTITSNAVGASYQWLNCDSNFAVVPNAVQQQFTPIEDGKYAVEVTQNGCKDTSRCVTIIGIGLDENTFPTAVQLQPNPTQGEFEIRLGQALEDLQIEVRDAKGALVERTSHPTADQINMEIDGPKGLYFVRLIVPTASVQFKVLKE